MDQACSALGGVPPRAPDATVIAFDVMDAALVLKATRAGVALARAANSSKELQRRFDDAAEQVNRETSQVAYAVAKALVGHALGETPSSEALDRFLANAVDDPSFPARAHRLLGEARKSASNRRRKLLASVLFGLPFSKTPADDRDRVDMLVERLVPEDVDLLAEIDSLERATSPGAYGTEQPCYALTHGQVRLVSADLLSADAIRQADVEAATSLASPAFTTLQAVGCINLSAGFSEAVVIEGASASAEAISITPLGRLLLGALAEVRAGLDAPVEQP